MNYGLKLAIYLRTNGISNVQFAELIDKNPVRISCLVRGKIKKPQKATAVLIEKYTNGHVTMEDMGYAPQVIEQTT